MRSTRRSGRPLGPAAAWVSAYLAMLSCYARAELERSAACATMDPRAPPLVSARQEILQRPDFPRRFLSGSVEDQLPSVRMHRKVLDVLHWDFELLGLAADCRHFPEASIATDPQQEALIASPG